VYVQLKYEILLQWFTHLTELLAVGKDKEVRNDNVIMKLYLFF
jgi:hypothetical protein